MVDVVLDAVAVAIADRWLVDEAQKPSQIGSFKAIGVAAARAQHQEGILLDEELDAAYGLGAELELVARVAE